MRIQTSKSGITLTFYKSVRNYVQCHIARCTPLCTRTCMCGINIHVHVDLVGITFGFSGLHCSVGLEGTLLEFFVVLGNAIHIAVSGTFTFLLPSFHSSLSYLTSPLLSIFPFSPSLLSPSLPDRYEQQKQAYEAGYSAAILKTDVPGGSVGQPGIMMTNPRHRRRKKDPDMPRRNM